MFTESESVPLNREDAYQTMTPFDDAISTDQTIQYLGCDRISYFTQSDEGGVGIGPTIAMIR